MGRKTQVIHSFYPCTDSPIHLPLFSYNWHLFQQTPYTMQDENGQLYGYIMDMLGEVGRRNRMKFDVYTAEKYGALEPSNKTWTGMIGQLIKREVL